jgi:hypothetical protein
VNVVICVVITLLLSLETMGRELTADLVIAGADDQARDRRPAQAARLIAFAAQRGARTRSTRR